MKKLDLELIAGSLGILLLVLFVGTLCYLACAALWCDLRVYQAEADAKIQAIAEGKAQS